LKAERVDEAAAATLLTVREFELKDCVVGRGDAVVEEEEEVAAVDEAELTEVACSEYEVEGVAASASVVRLVPYVQIATGALVEETRAASEDVLRLELEVSSSSSSLSTFCR
jgi:hypothetical protein